MSVQSGQTKKYISMCRNCVCVLFHSVLLFGGLNYQYYGMTFALKKKSDCNERYSHWTASFLETNNAKIPPNQPWNCDVVACTHRLLHNVLSLSLIYHWKDIFGESEAQTKVTCKLHLIIYFFKKRVIFLKDRGRKMRTISSHWVNQRNKATIFPPLILPLLKCNVIFSRKIYQKSLGGAWLIFLCSLKMGPLAE